LRAETEVQRTIRDCRQELMRAVSQKDKCRAALAAARLYQLTHPPPPPPPPSVKVKREAKEAGELGEDDLPLSELMKSHPTPVKIELERREEHGTSATATAVPSKKRKRGNKQRPQPRSSSSDNDDKGAEADHAASRARKVRHS
jgi:hypothetical protein